jgi:hypothetical protein
LQLAMALRSKLPPFIVSDSRLNCFR